MSERSAIDWSGMNGFLYDLIYNYNIYKHSKWNSLIHKCLPDKCIDVNYQLRQKINTFYSLSENVILSYLKSALIRG